MLNCITLQQTSMNVSQTIRALLPTPARMKMVPIAVSVPLVITTLTKTLARVGWENFLFFSTSRCCFCKS